MDYFINFTGIVCIYFLILCLIPLFEEIGFFIVVALLIYFTIYVCNNYDFAFYIGTI